MGLQDSRHLTTSCKCTANVPSIYMVNMANSFMHGLSGTASQNKQIELMFLYTKWLRDNFIRGNPFMPHGHATWQC